MEIKMHPTLGILVREDGAVYLAGKNNRWKPHWSYGWKNSSGYMRVKIEGISYAVHRLVAETFLSNPESKPTVDHIDRNPLNNSVHNLRYATHHEQSMNCSTHLNSHTPVMQSADPNGYKRAYWALNREKCRKYIREYMREYTRAHRAKKEVA